MVCREAVAAVPRQAVQNVPGQRSQAPQKPVMRGPGQPAAKAQPSPDKAAPDPQSPVPDPRSKKKSPLPAILGIAATVIVGGGLVFMFSGKQGGDTTGGGANAAAPATPAAPIKVIDTPKPASSGAPTFSASTEPWVDRMNDRVVATKGSLTREGTAWRLNKLTGFRFPEVMTDGAVRLLRSEPIR